MNIKEYIESGILEAYVLGALTEDERIGVESDIALYPELAAELAAIEEAMLNLAQDQAVPPPAFMQEQIWEALDNETTEEEPAEDNNPAPTQTIPIPPKQPSWQRAAIWAAVIVSALTNFILLSQRNQSRDQQMALVAKVDSMEATQQQLATVIDAYKKEKDLLADPGMKTVVMHKEGDTHMAGVVYWNKEKGDAYLAFHNMPLPPQGKQYQLWVIQDGKPVDMGVISNDMVAKDGSLKKIPLNVQSGQAFAISLEKEGGNPTPTQVYMVGVI
ncbi:MAG: anti-sigma factor [Chitinophagaceae bacterium]|nr:anti-sigma factor [Chitinophagaceae bacterium]